MKIQKIMILIFLISSFNSKIFANAEDAYLQENPWDYLEQVFIAGSRTPSELDWSKIKNTSCAFLLTTALTAVVAGVILTEGFKRDDVYVFPISFLGGIVGAILWNMTINYKSIYDALEEVLKKYDPDLNKLENNTKKYIPKELHATFDLLYEQYQKNGRGCLEAQANNVLFYIRDKIMAQLKAGKYYRPIVNVYR